MTTATRNAKRVAGTLIASTESQSVSATLHRLAVHTRMSDIARRAGVHRSTVYYYFSKKDALLAASFVRVLAATAEAVEQCWQTDEPFLTQLIAASLRGIDIARSSPIMRSLIEEH